MSRDRGDYGQAAAQYCDALLGWREIGHKTGLAGWLMVATFLAATVGERERAASWFGTVEAQTEVLGISFSAHRTGAHRSTRGRGPGRPWRCGLQPPRMRAVGRARWNTPPPRRRRCWPRWQRGTIRANRTIRRAAQADSTHTRSPTPARKQTITRGDRGRVLRSSGRRRNRSRPTLPQHRCHRPRHRRPHLTRS